ncbi:carbohydrate ABC transporter permease [Hungatella hathewayi]|nr:carbohydrate ABC transporter permease [Hungatella hathewayi]
MVYDNDDDDDGAVFSYTYTTIYHFTENASVEHLCGTDSAAIFSICDFIYISDYDTYGSLPKSLFEMATIEGASDFKIFYYIALPLSKPILATVCITTLISSWNNYIWPLVSANAEKVRPVILQVSKVVASTYQMPGVNFAAYVIASVPLLLIFTVATKPFVEGLTAGAVKA